MISEPTALRVEVAGDPARPTIVFLHGLGVSSWMWSDQVEHLSSRFSCLTVDLPGSGASAGTPWRSFDDTADAVAAVIAATPAGRAHVVSLSLGGYVAVTLAARRPEVVDHVVVSGITAEPLRPAWRYQLFTRVGAAVVRQPWLARATAAALRLPRAAREAMVDDARVLTAATTRRVYDEILGFALPAGMRTVAERILAVAADHDMRPVRRGLEAFAAHGATTATAPDAHHAWNAEHPQLFNDMIESWIRDRTVPPGLEQVTRRGDLRHPRARQQR